MKVVQLVEFALTCAALAGERIKRFCINNPPNISSLDDGVGCSHCTSCIMPLMQRKGMIYRDEDESKQVKIFGVKCVASAVSTAIIVAAIIKVDDARGVTTRPVFIGLFNE